MNAGRYLDGRSCALVNGSSGIFGVRLAETSALMEDWLLPLVEAGVDVLHCSQRRFWDPEFPEIDGWNGLNCAGCAKKVTGATTINVGSVGLDNELLTHSPARYQPLRAWIGSSSVWSVKNLI